MRLVQSCHLVGTLLVLVAGAPVFGGCTISDTADGIPYDPTPMPDFEIKEPDAIQDASPDWSGTTRADTSIPDEETTVPTDGEHCLEATFDRDTANLPTTPFAKPMAILVDREHVFVANHNPRADGSAGQGFITVIERATLRVRNRLPTSQPYPVALAVQDEALWVLNRGEITFDPTVERDLPSSPGGIDVLDNVASAVDAPGFSRTIPLVHRGAIGAPVSMAVGTDGLAYLGSGTAGALFIVDVANCAVIRGPADHFPIGEQDEQKSILLRATGDGSILALFPADGVMRVFGEATRMVDDQATHPGSPYGVGDGGQTLPSDFVYVPGATPDIFVVMGPEGKVTTLEMDTGHIDAGAFRAGRDPRAIEVHGRYVYVVNAGDDALQRIDLTLAADAVDLSFVLLSPGDAPVAIGLTEDARQAFVANSGSDTVALVDLEAGRVARIFGFAPLGPGCTAPVTSPEPLPDQPFASPGGVLRAGGYVFVLNSNLDEFWTPGQGFVTVLDPATLEIVNRIPTTQLNPQSLASDGASVFVVNAGVTSADVDSGLMLPQSPGGVDIIALDQAASATLPAANIELPLAPDTPLAGSPGGIYLVPSPPTGYTTPYTGVAYLGSGTGPYLFKVNLRTCEWLRGSDDPVVLDESISDSDLTTPFEGPGGLVAALSMKSDQLHLIDPFTGDMNPAPYDAPYSLTPGDGPGGPIDGLFREENFDIFVLLSLTPRVATINTDSGQVNTAWVVAGSIPNRLRRLGDDLYVVNSGDDAVQKVSLAGHTVDEVHFKLPPGSNPWDLAFAVLPDYARRAFITNLMTSTVQVFDAHSGAELGEL